MADDGNQQRKPDFRTAVEDNKALATVLGIEKLSLRSPTVLAVLGVAATVVLALVVVIALLGTGGTETVTANAALIGALVALGGVFTAQMVSIALDDRRAQEARELEAQRAHEAALQKYFEQVGTLLIEQPLHRASPGDNLSTVVRAQTLAVLEGLDSARKRILLQFLYESGLISRDKPVVNLSLANVSEAELSGAYLREADLSYAYLSGANLSQSNLTWALLSEANLREADLSYANLSGANLSEADLSGAILMGANLSDAYLSGAILSKAVLLGAYLSGANLSEADLSGAILRRVHGVTQKQLEEQAKTLEGAIMPDGSQHP